MAYTERPAIIQFFQIIMLGISLGLESYAYQVDNNFKKGLSAHGSKSICLYLMKSVDPDKFNDIKSSYSNLAAKDGKKTSDAYKKDQSFFTKTITRGASAEERAAIIIMCLSMVLLVFHLGVACISKNYAYRTKWTAAAQGIVVFSSAFSAIFIAISAHSYETSYHKLAVKFPECALLGACYNNMYKNETQLAKYLKSKNFKSNLVEKVQAVLAKESVCQEFHLKIIAAAICGVTILLSQIVICNAMDLTTIYNEEDVDEDEQQRRQAFHMHALHAKRKMHGVGKMSEDDGADSQSFIQELQETKELEKLESERLLAPRAKKSIKYVY